MHGEQRSVPRSFNKTALTAAGGSPPSGPLLARGVSRDYEIQSSEGGGEVRPRAAAKSVSVRGEGGPEPKQSVVKPLRYSLPQLSAGVTPGPSDSFHPSGSPDIRERAAFVFVGAFCIAVALVMTILTHVPFLDFFDLG